MPDLALTHIYQPPRQPAASPPPLLVLLHGVGSSEHDLVGLAGDLTYRLYPMGHEVGGAALSEVDEWLRAH